MKLGLFDGVEVAEDIGASEGVDGLFRVTDEPESAIVLEEGLEDGGLGGIGVLEFVDESGGEAGAGGGDEGRA